MTSGLLFAVLLVAMLSQPRRSTPLPLPTDGGEFIPKRADRACSIYFYVDPFLRAEMMAREGERAARKKDPLLERKVGLYPTGFFFGRFWKTKVCVCIYVLFHLTRPKSMYKKNKSCLPLEANNLLVTRLKTCSTIASSCLKKHVMERVIRLSYNNTMFQC